MEHLLFVRHCAYPKGYRSKEALKGLTCSAGKKGGRLL